MYNIHTYTVTYACLFVIGVYVCVCVSFASLLGPNVHVVTHVSQPPARPSTFIAHPHISLCFFLRSMKIRQTPQLRWEELSVSSWVYHVIELRWLFLVINTTAVHYAKFYHASSVLSRPV